MKPIIALLFLSAPMTACAAAPAVGLWEDVVAIDDDTLQLISHQHFIFTDQKLATPAVFTALKDFGGEIDTFCCLEVQNTTPLSMREIEKKLSHDHDFVQRVSHIHGLPYMYEAKLANRTIWNNKMLLLKGSKNDGNDIPFSAPVIATRLAFSEIAGNRFTDSDGDEILLKTEVPKRGQGQPLVHRFTVNHKKIIFTVPMLGD
ncbi:hypothetical protein BCF11_0851 [Collimonas sp. PA-H2]|uniref:hypothetical protein n=1 Tax=Collimonas sp. PA-H2 TaxID=1881062 RepID=UPI000BF4354D|nr:hypothetical protein [Collimonas sp. PA-H2]PFH08496.1 hypothetical protein BCF11_0851 [Collimonas sp. PA-H2]